MKKVFVEQRDNVIVNRLNKTKVEKFPDLRQEKDDRLQEIRQREDAVRQERVSSSIYYYQITLPLHPPSSRVRARSWYRRDD